MLDIKENSRWMHIASEEIFTFHAKCEAVEDGESLAKEEIIFVMKSERNGKMMYWKPEEFSNVFSNLN